MRHTKILKGAGVVAVFVTVVAAAAFAQGMMGRGSGMMHGGRHMMHGGRHMMGGGHGMMGRDWGATDDSGSAITGAPAQAGAALFRQNCASCHGENGAGGLRIGNATSADLRAPGLEDRYRHSDTALAGAILKGTDEKGRRLSPAMPRFQGSLSSDQVSDLIDYLKSLRG